MILTYIITLLGASSEELPFSFWCPYVQLNQIISTTPNLLIGQTQK